MKFLLSISLFMSLTSLSEASEVYGGIKLDSSLTNSQASILKNDLKYLYQYSPRKVDNELKAMMELKEMNGPSLHNWIYNRVKFILGESFSLRNKDILRKSGFRFPNTPLPKLSNDGANSYGGVIIMTNIGAGLYLNGKMNKVLMGLNIDGVKEFARSPRVGIVQVGEGLFKESLLIAKNEDAEANKIKRLGTIIHEARHSDGHSEHVGFIHDICPTGHPLAGHSACEKYKNGPYSLEAMAVKSFLDNCKTCTTTEATKLNAITADAYSRVVLRSHMKSETQLMNELKSYSAVITFYEDYIKKNPKIGANYIKELERLKKLHIEAENQLQELKTPVKALSFDSRPEGPFKDLSVEATRKFMGRE